VHTCTHSCVQILSQDTCFEHGPEYGRAWYRGTLLMFDQKVLGPVEFEATKFRMWEFRNAYEVLERRGGRGRKEGREGERLGVRERERGQTNWEMECSRHRVRADCEFVSMKRGCSRQRWPCTPMQQERWSVLTQYTIYIYLSMLMLPSPCDRLR